MLAIMTPHSLAPRPLLFLEGMRQRIIHVRFVTVSMGAVPPCHNNCPHTSAACKEGHSLQFICVTRVGIHVEITTEESSQNIGGATSSTSSTGDIEEDDENLPTLSSEQLARRPSFK